jgi:hypothetical protein
MGTTFSSAALTLDIRALPMSSSVMAVGALAWVAQQAYSSSSSSSSPSTMNATAFAPVILVTAGWALLYYAFLFDQSVGLYKLNPANLEPQSNVMSWFRVFAFANATCTATRRRVRSYRSRR